MDLGPVLMPGENVLPVQMKVVLQVEIVRHSDFEPIFNPKASLTC